MLRSSASRLLILIIVGLAGSCVMMPAGPGIVTSEPKPVAVETRQISFLPQIRSAPWETPVPTGEPAIVTEPEPTPVVGVTPTPEAAPLIDVSPVAEPVTTETDMPSPPVPLAQLTPPGPTPQGTTRSVRVPILMYHYISSPLPGADKYRRDLSVSPERFESHLQYLRDAGYHAISLDDLLYHLTQGSPLPAKPVILTFDDGYADNYTNAFPLLQRYGIAAHFFIITDFVNAQNPNYMTWPQIEEMAAAGQFFGSHSRDHPRLAGQPLDYLIWQALGGAEAIEEHLGYHPRWIAYPSGYYDAQTIAVYQSANYWGGLTTHQGATHSSDQLFELKRVRVRGSYTTEYLDILLNLEW